jgi:hypothetical protein
MTTQFRYETTLKVQGEGVLTLPVADFRVSGRLDTGRDFAGQVGHSFGTFLNLIFPRLDKARNP